MATDRYNYNIGEWIMGKSNIFIDKWKYMMGEEIKKSSPSASYEDIEKYLNGIIEKNLKNPKCVIDNNYIHKAINSNCLEIIDWIENTKPICGGHGVFYKNQHQVKIGRASCRERV